ncbi:hypothetical protein [Hafnia alvei]|nr:hypothetical protein [Hafnia alvei]TBM13617.1 hypothetical protein EYY84_12100 [Hafnia alvei]
MSNTTFDYILYYHKKKKNYYLLLKCHLYMSLIGKFLNKIGIFSIRKFMISTLQGCRKDELYRLADGFYLDILSKKVNHDVFAILLGLPKKSTILISASIDPVIYSISKHLSITGYSSVLEYDIKNKATSKLSKDLKGVKSKVMLDQEIDLIVTDNFSDIDVVCAAKKAILISSFKNRKRWNVLMEAYQVNLNKVEYL